MTQEPRYWLQNLTLLQGPSTPVERGDALLSADGTLLALAESAAETARAAGLSPCDGQGWWLGPSLVDPHSVLSQPLLGRAETLTSLAAAAAAGGYGQVALLPWAHPLRDQPEQLQLSWQEPQSLHLWASLCRLDGDQDLAPHRDLLAAGAIGLAGTAELPPLNLLERSLQLGEMGERPLLVAPRQRQLSADGLVRERVEALRAGWPVDPPCSEVLPLSVLLSLQASHPDRRLVAMNLSTAEAVNQLQRQQQRPLATVHWWQLLHDSSSLAPTSNGWRLEPPLGGPQDRQALRQALLDGLITAVAVHHEALDAEEQLLPIDQRRCGLAGHGWVLPLLAKALVGEAGWSAHQLWQALCWGPCRVLGLAPEILRTGSRRWILFDPDGAWSWPQQTPPSLAANPPLPQAASLSGCIRASGLLPQSSWTLP